MLTYLFYFCFLQTVFEFFLNWNYIFFALCIKGVLITIKAGLLIVQSCLLKYSIVIDVSKFYILLLCLHFRCWWHFQLVKWLWSGYRSCGTSLRWCHRSNYDQVLFVSPPITLTWFEPKTCGLQAQYHDPLPTLSTWLGDGSRKYFISFLAWLKY